MIFTPINKFEEQSKVRRANVLGNLESTLRSMPIKTVILMKPEFSKYDKFNLAIYDHPKLINLAQESRFGLLYRSFLANISINTFVWAEKENLYNQFKDFFDDTNNQFDNGYSVLGHYNEEELVTKISMVKNVGLNQLDTTDYLQKLKSYLDLKGDYCD